MYGWSGIYGTNFWVDPKEHLIGIMMVQLYPGVPVSSSFQMLVYQALTRSDYSQAPRSGQTSTGSKQPVSGATAR
jgi:CubicO group peptidase (beta-lactamase class C family)